MDPAAPCAGPPPLSLPNALQHAKPVANMAGVRYDSGGKRPCRRSVACHGATGARRCRVARREKRSIRPSGPAHVPGWRSPRRASETRSRSRWRCRGTKPSPRKASVSCGAVHAGSSAARRARRGHNRREDGPAAGTAAGPAVSTMADGRVLERSMLHAAGAGTARYRGVISRCRLRRSGPRRRTGRRGLRSWRSSSPSPATRRSTGGRRSRRPTGRGTTPARRIAVYEAMLATLERFGLGRRARGGTLRLPVTQKVTSRPLRQFRSPFGK